jgi:hypothetical protein
MKQCIASTPEVQKQEVFEKCKNGMTAYKSAD